MSSKMEYQGKDVDEAINTACSSLNVSRDELDIEIKSTGSAGIFGLCRKNAVVLVSLRGKAVIGVAAEKATNAKPGRAKKARPAPVKSAPVEVSSAEPPPPPAKKQREAGVPVSQEVQGQIKTEIEELLRLMGYPSPVTVEMEDDQVHVRITGEHVDTVVGPEGKTLDALQYLSRKMVSKRFPEKIALVIDAGEFRAERMKELEEAARDFARQAKEDGKTFSFPPLNPAERRIVHMALQDDTEIRSRSVGDGLFKKVLIYQPGKGPRKGGRRRPPQQKR